MYVFNEMINRIKKLEKEKGITNIELSHKTGIPLSTMAKMMTMVIKEPSVTSISKIACALDVTLDYLIFGERETEYSLSTNEKEIISNYRKLNTLGQEKVKEYITDILENEKYTRSEEEPRTKLNA